MEVGVNDLDRKIAGLKGMKDPDKLEGLEVVALIGGDYSWSTSDSKALELVDELLAEFNHEWEIMIRKIPCSRVWWVAISDKENTFWRHKGHSFEAEASTRPEAICRAYIAAREWMEKQGKG
jgi:hypothetical protein